MTTQAIGTESNRPPVRLFKRLRRALTVTDSAKRNFIVQLGFDEPATADIAREYSALTFQPRVVLTVIAVGILFQSQAVFAALGAVLVGSALLPKLNPFTALYNLTLGSRPGAYRVGPTPAPRRGAETEAGTIAMTIALLIHGGFGAAAYVAEGVLLAAALAVRLKGFCTGSFFYHLARGQWKFALKTLPWAG